MTVSCRVPTPADADKLTLLHVASWREAYRGIVPDTVLDSIDIADRTEKWRGHLAAEGYLTFLAEVSGEAAGFIRAGLPAHSLVEGADGHIFALYILRRHYRQGIGRKLIGLVAAHWLQQGGAALSVGVLAANVRARAFYQALGARYVRPDTYEWDGHALEESIYVFENLPQLAHFA